MNVWRVDAHGDLHLIFESPENGYITGLTEQESAVYFFTVDESESCLYKMDKVTEKISTISVIPRDECLLWCWAGVLEYGDSLYCNTLFEDDLSSPVVQISKVDGSFQRLDISHSYYYTVKLFDISNNIIYTYDWDSDAEDYCIYTYNISENTTSKYEIRGLLAAAGVSEISRLIAYFSEDAVYIMEIKDGYDVPMKIYRADLDKALEFREFVELPGFDFNNALISDEALVYPHDAGGLAAELILMDKDGNTRELFQDDYWYEEIMYHQDFFVYVPANSDGNEFYIGDYSGDVREYRTS